MTALISAAAAPMRNVAPIPVCRLKCCGSMPTAARPVRTPPAAPLIAAASKPFSHSSTRFIIVPDSAGLCSSPLPRGEAFPIHLGGASQRRKSSGLNGRPELQHRDERLPVKRGNGVVEQVVGPGVIAALLALLAIGK